MKARILWQGCLIGLLYGLVFGSVSAQELTLRQLPAYYHPVKFFEGDELPDKIKGFERVQDYASQQAVSYFTRRLGQSWLTEEVVSTALEAAVETFRPTQSGRIHIGSPVRILDKTMNHFIADHKKQFAQWARDFFPSLPILGNALVDLVESQKLSFSRGVPEHRVNLRKPLDWKFRSESFLFSAGTVVQWLGTEFHRTPVLGFQYEGEGAHCDIHFSGKQAQFQVETDRLKADMTWNSRGVEFEVRLTF